MKPNRPLQAIAFFAALLAGCGGRQAPEPTASEPRSTEDGAVGDVPPLPEPEDYAAKLDSRERYWWQQPEDVVEMLRCKRGMTVVDLGSGTGYFIPYLSRAVGREGRVFALDVDRGMVERLYERVARDRMHNVTPVIVAVDDPSLTPRSADRILVVNTWHHLENRVEYAEKLFSALRTHGEILIVDFDMNSPKGPPPAHRLEPTVVADELEAAGFAVARIVENLPYQYAVRGFVR